MDTDVDGSKRRSSTPSSSSVKRAKTEHGDTGLGSPLPLNAPQGVERIRFPPSINVKRLPSRYLERLATERTKVLREQGRHVVGLPVVLGDGIVLNWVRRKADDIPQIDTLAKCESKGALSPIIPAGRGSGTSATDAIIIDSDEDIRRTSSPPCTVMPREHPVNRDTSLDQDVIDYSDSDTELLSPACSESRAGIDQAASSCSPFSPPARECSLEDVSDTTTSDLLPGPALAKQDVAVALSGLCSDDTDVTVSGLEPDGTDEEVNEVEDINGRISARHVKPSPHPSLHPIRNLLARRKRRGDPDRDALPRETDIASQASQKPRKRVSEGDPTVTSEEGDEDSELQASDLQYKRVPLPKTDHGRARRLLVPDSVDLPLVAVTMRGDCHFIERRGKYRITGYSLPNPGVFRHVADVCMVGSTAVLGCDKGTDQISFVSVAGKPQMTSVAWSPHSSGPRYQDTRRRGVSCLAAVHAKGGHIKFLSGGYDGTIHEWTARVGKLGEPRSRRVASHGACIMALAYRDRDSAIVASAQRKLHITDLNRCTTLVHPFSNVIQQIHIHPQAAYVTLLEAFGKVRHLDRQIQLYDSRKANFDTEPCLSFGHRNASSKFPATHTRGSTHLVHFAKASEDGCVLLWDFRNSKRAVVERQFEPAEQVVHTIFADRDIATFGQGVVTFFEDYLAR